MSDNILSRRRLVGGLGAGIAAATLPGAAAAAQTSAADATAQPVADPTSKYPKPPYTSPFQPWPGLASKMTPPPDHGETSYKGSGRLLDRKALITGGDSGMGRAAAIAYAREGADVAINYLPAEEPDAQQVAQLIRQAGRKAALIPGDLRDENFCKRLVEQTVQQLGGLDIVVSNAGRQHQVESIADMTTELFDWTMKTNIYAPFWIIKAALPHLKPGSAIIATTSEQAYDPAANLYDYAQTKAATMNFVKSLAKQFGPKGIRVNGVAPGPIYTPLQISGGATEEHWRNFGGNYPLKRAGQPAELASIYVQLASQDASYTTGNIYGAGGGMGQP
ncbi:SDR family oxidoreductase [Terriglobus aquaticus]|uniref:SDR family oxidoreductase n=1 Tax=Terriglobus aquaticus TaxID=940139 RepID=A0ABW9KNY5_9BACT|nr:SDR family oxidoreductase [Terriglobus aquaticus]